MSKYFTPADFSEFEEGEEVSVKKAPVVSLPTKAELKNIADRLNAELIRCESGISKHTHITVQTNTTVGTKNAMGVMLTNFTTENVLNFLEMLKQDYGLRVAEWAAQDVLGPYCTEAINRAGEWRNG